MSDSEQIPTAPSARFPQLVEQVFLRAERLTHGFLFRKRIKYNGDKKSLTRLWASWKKRYAVLSPGLLRLFPTENQTELDFGKFSGKYCASSSSTCYYPYSAAKFMTPYHGLILWTICMPHQSWFHREMRGVFAAERVDPITPICIHRILSCTIPTTKWF